MMINQCQDQILRHFNLFGRFVRFEGPFPATGVSSSDPITPTGFPVVGNYKTIDAVGSMSLFTGDFNPGVGEITDRYDFEMLQFKLSVSSIEGIDVDDLTITHQGTGDQEASPGIEK